MNDLKILDVVAYYLSEFDGDAFAFLGYENQSKGFDWLSTVFGCKSSYIRRLRDEYDVVTNSARKGQRNRPPRKRILETKAAFQYYDFDELSGIVSAFIENALSDSEEPQMYMHVDSEIDVANLSEQNIEQIINYVDPGAKIRVSSSNHTVRVYNTNIIRQLKKLYGGKCQLCGTHAEVNGIIVDITEAHHIDYFSASKNNNASNIIILCPNHHALIHKLNPSFDEADKKYLFANGGELEVKINYHL